MKTRKAKVVMMLTELPQTDDGIVGDLYTQPSRMPNTARVGHPTVWILRRSSVPSIVIPTRLRASWLPRLLLLRLLPVQPQVQQLRQRATGSNTPQEPDPSAPLWLQLELESCLLGASLPSPVSFVAATQCRQGMHDAG